MSEGNDKVTAKARARAKEIVTTKEAWLKATPSERFLALVLTEPSVWDDGGDADFEKMIDEVARG